MKKTKNGAWELGAEANDPVSGGRGVFPQNVHTKDFQGWKKIMRRLEVWLGDSISTQEIQAWELQGKRNENIQFSCYKEFFLKDGTILGWREISSFNSSYEN